MINLGMECMSNEMCVPTMKCMFAKDILDMAKESTNRAEKIELISIVKERLCGKRSDKTICCHNTEIMEYGKFAKILP